MWRQHLSKTALAIVQIALGASLFLLTSTPGPTRPELKPHIVPPTGSGALVE